MKDYSTVPNTTGSFPNVASQNTSGPGETDGTPYIAQVIDDLWGARQALMDYAELIPSGVQESASNSQFLNALNILVAKFLFLTSLKNWKQINSTNVGNDDLRDITYGCGGYWIAVGTIDGNQIQVGFTGGDWTSITPPVAESFYGVHATATHAVAVGRNGTLIYTTNPGSWTDGSSNISTGGADLIKVWYGNGYWCCVDENGYVYYTTDPTGTWTQRSTPASANSYRLDNIRYINELSLWVAVGQKQTSPAFSGIITATDPTGTWTEQTNPISGSALFTDITYNGTNIIVTGGSGTSYTNCIISANGTTWTDKSSSLPSTSEISSCEAVEPSASAYGDLFGAIIISSGSYLYISLDNCDNWTVVDSDGLYTYKSGRAVSDAAGFRIIFVGFDDILRSWSF